jgi:hypothetical protein
MGETYEGNGVDFTFAGLTLEPKTIEIPGWSKEELKISTLQNTDVHTKFVAALKDYGKLFIVTPFDASEYGSLPETEQDLVISVPSVGSITFYAEISELDAITQAKQVLKLPRRSLLNLIKQGANYESYTRTERTGKETQC